MPVFSSSSAFDTAFPTFLRFRRMCAHIVTQSMSGRCRPIVAKRTLAMKKQSILPAFASLW